MFLAWSNLKIKNFNILEYDSRILKSSILMFVGAVGVGVGQGKFTLELFSFYVGWPSNEKL